ncbi:hypothetical protein V6N13_048399 [Hibiscus sabdariffa]
MCLVFKNVGLGETCEQWNKGISKLKYEAVKWKKSCKANESRVNTLWDELRAVEVQRDDIKADLWFERTKQGALDEYI